MPEMLDLRDQPGDDGGHHDAELGQRDRQPGLRGPELGRARDAQHPTARSPDLPNIAESQVTNLTSDLAAKVTGTPARQHDGAAQSAGEP